MCSWTDHSNYFFNSISSLRLNEILTDVTITCGDKYFQAHKLVLCASSEYFRSILANNIEKLAIVHIVGVPPVYIHNILQYLYTGQIEITPSEVEPFLRVANDLKICGLYKDDQNFIPISDPDPEPDPEPVDPVEQAESYKNNSMPFIPALDPTLRTRFKNPIPIDELRIKKKVRGSEPTLGNSLPTNIVESRNSSEEKALEQSDGHMEHSAAAAALSSLAVAVVKAAKEEAASRNKSGGSQEEITIVPDIVDLNEDSNEKVTRDNKENLSGSSGQSSRGVSPRRPSPSPSEALAAVAAATSRRMSASPGVQVTTGGSPLTIVSMADLSERRSNFTSTTPSSMSQFSIRTNALAVDPAALVVNLEEAPAAVIRTRSASINKRKSIPTKLDTSIGDDKRIRMDASSPILPVSFSQMTSLPITCTSIVPNSSSPLLSTSVGSSAHSTVMSLTSSTSSAASLSPLTSLTTSSLNSPYLRSSSNPCKGLTPLNCRKGHNGNRY